MSKMEQLLVSIRVENLRTLLYGELLNTPKISNVIGIYTNAQKVGYQGAFISLSNSKEDIEIAIRKGAYAIIFCGDFDIKCFNNNDIAYIKVKDISHCIFRLMRYFATFFELEFIILNSVEKEILLKISDEIFLDKNNLKNTLDLILNSKNRQKFYCDSEYFIKNFCSNYKFLPKFKPDSIYNSTLFISSFSLDGNDYKIPIPRLFIDDFCSVFKSIKGVNINKFISLKSIRHFIPIFVDYSFGATKFGLTPRAVICETDKDVFIKSALFLQNNYSGSKILVFDHKKAGELTKNGVKAIFCQELNEIKKQKDFRYILIDVDFDIICKFLTPQEYPNLPIFF